MNCGKRSAASTLVELLTATLTFDLSISRSSLQVRSDLLSEAQKAQNDVVAELQGS